MTLVIHLNYKIKILHLHFTFTFDIFVIYPISMYNTLQRMATRVAETCTLSRTKIHQRDILYVLLRQ